MMENRSFAPSDDAPPPFPVWPYACMAYVEHCAHDYVDYVARLSKADDAMAVVRAEESLGLHLLSDMNQALFALVWSPFSSVFGDPGDGDAPAP